MAPLFSVVIPAHNEEKTLGSAIESILCQTEQDFEIIIINDNSSDNTELICEKYHKQDSRVFYWPQYCGSAASARNAGVEFAEGTYIVFHDADCIMDPCLLNNAAKYFEDYDVDGVATKTLNTKPQSWIQHAMATQRKARWESSQSSPMMLEKDSGINVAIMCRDCFEHLGGFNEDIFYFEDNDLTARFFDAGNIAIFGPDVIQYHQDPLTLRESVNQCKSIAKGMLKRKELTGREKFTINIMFVFWICLLSGLAGVNILLFIPFLMICGIFVYMFMKTNELIGSLLFVILYILRTSAKTWYYYTEKIE